MRVGKIKLRLNKIMVIISIIAILLLLVAIFLVYVFKNDALDNALFTFSASIRSDGMTKFMRFITFLGNHKFLIPANLILLVVFFFTKQRWWAILVAALSLSGFVVLSLLKKVLQRDRPSESLVDGITNFSFPSGHAFMSVAFYGLLIIVFDVFVKSLTARIVFTTLFILLILAIGFTRIYLRVHYTTDVIAGLCIGSMWLIFCFAVIKAFEARHLDRKLTKLTQGL